MSLWLRARPFRFSSIRLDMITVMNGDKLKSEMVKLWRDTFHDSNEYIEMFFSSYFNEEYVEYAEENGRLLSMLIGVPYSFSNGIEEFKAVYLCGLATVKDCRGRGIMKELMRRFELRMRDRGVALSFLIPANDSLRVYYNGMGYANGIPKVVENYSSGHDFRWEWNNSLALDRPLIRELKSNYHDSLNVVKYTHTDVSVRNEIVDFIAECEHEKQGYFQIQHDSKSVNDILHDCHISGDTVYFCTGNDGNICGVAFAMRRAGYVMVKHMYCNDDIVKYRLLEHVKTDNPSLQVAVTEYVTLRNRTVAISDEYYNAEGVTPPTSFNRIESIPVSNTLGNLRNYGMCKILDYRNFFRVLAAVNPDVSVKFLFNIPVKDSILSCTMHRGECGIREISNQDFMKIKGHHSNVTVYSERDLNEIVFRKPSSNSLVMEALDIPRMPLNMCLMLE